jgi:tetratricopeptide (TPR) repeat protein
MNRLRPPVAVPVILLVCLALFAGGGCDKNKRLARKQAKQEAALAKKQAKEQAAREKAAKKDPAAPRDKFEASDDPPLQANTYFAAGQVAESQGNFDSAIAQYKEALQRDPNHRDAQFRLAGAYTQRGLYEQAIPAWQHYLKLTNNSSAAYNNLALCYELAGKPAEAEQTYRAGIEKDPANASCRTNYGLMLARTDRLDESMEQLSKVLAPAEVHYNLGSVMEQKGKKEEAKAYYRKALELDPKLADARSRLAKLK